MASSDFDTQRGRKGFISEKDIALVLTRYSAPTILALLKEIAQYPDVKIDWNVLVNKTTSGITNAAKYQKLRRHLAYCDKLPEIIEEKIEEQPLEEDDSDLEYELEALCPVNDEASLEAAGGGSATVEAPLTINIPTWQDYKMTTTVLRTAEEGLDATASNAGGQPEKGKRMHWTAEDDNELIAVVKKFGKRNWADILKRWGILRKGLKLETGGGDLIARQRATNRSVSSALNMPIINSLLAAYAASVVPNPMVQEAIVAAGARIATPLTAKSLRRAARSKKSSMPGVHYICTDLSSASPTTYSTSAPSVSPPPPTPAVKS
ncbi:uncharacterized protein LOC113304933 [Papaver somniferum]|uniref:uncharacterized protein LOC113304933 n=1 Tax=Papaver somniferum TaxID=3469 RepID=UPI000E6F6266|nr:uncharacterized protein LOC113304933 [Papaver somniferum]